MTTFSIDGSLVLGGQVESGAANFNGAQIVGSSSGVDPQFVALGSDTNINLLIAGKATGGVGLGGIGSTFVGAALQVAANSTSVNGMLISGASSADPSLGVFGSSAHINMLLTAKGTGALKFGSTGFYTANGTVGASFTTTSAPTGASTAIQRWLTVIDSTGRTNFIPAW